MKSGGVTAAVIGSGNIGTDLMIEVMHVSDGLEMGVMVGIDPESGGLARAARFGVPFAGKYSLHSAVRLRTRPPSALKQRSGL